MRSEDAAVQVVVCDDHPLIREAVARWVSEDPALQLVGETDGVSSALDAISATEPDVAVVDMRLGDGDAFDLLRALDDLGQNARVLILSSFEDPAVVHKALEAGAAGYLSKSADGGSVCAAVRAIARGERVIAPHLQSSVFAEISRRRREPEANAPSTLSQRERAALTLAAHGRNEREIAKELSVSTSSVKSYMRRAYEKLGVRDRASAVGEAVRRGMID